MVHRYNSDFGCLEAAVVYASKPALIVYIESGRKHDIARF